MRAHLRLAMLLSLALPAALSGAGPSKTPSSRPAARPAAVRDWSQVVAATPEGGYRMGNPNAPVKLIEFASISCPHCAQFNAHSAETLRGNYVKSGRVSWEYRPFMIFPTDPGIFLLLSCLGPAGFFPASDQLYEQQGQWSGRLQNLSRAEQERIQALPENEQTAALVRATGVDQMLRARGMSQARLDACFADQPRLLRLVEVTRTASAKFGVSGTPTFMLNGRILDGVHVWEDLEPHLKSGG